jgi:hypothetical protein
LGPWAFREAFYFFSGPRGYLSPTPGARGHAQCAEERWCGGSGVRCSGAVGRSVELQGRSVGRGRGAPAGWLGVLARGLGRRCSAWDEVGIEEREDAVADAGEHGLDLGAVGVDGEREEKGGERVGGGGLRGGGAAARGQRSAGGARRGVRAARLSGARTAAQGRRGSRGTAGAGAGVAAPVPASGRRKKKTGSIPYWNN